MTDPHATEWQCGRGKGAAQQDRSPNIEADEVISGESATKVGDTMKG